MIKEVPCMDCDGKGFIAKFSEYSVWSERCPNCGGTGIVKVPMTNADRIRAMSDEELANEMRKRSVSTICDIVCQGGCEAIATLNKTGNEACREIIMKWLQQPAEEDI